MGKEFDGSRDRKGQAEGGPQAVSGIRPLRGQRVVSRQGGASLESQSRPGLSDQTPDQQSDQKGNRSFAGQTDLNFRRRRPDHEYRTQTRSDTAKAIGFADPQAD